VAAPSIHRISKLLCEGEQAQAFLPGTPPAQDARPTHVIFDRVSFKTAVLNLTLKLDLTTKLAVLGEVGSGKTTLLKLLCGQIPPESGSIRIRFSDGTEHFLWEEATYHRFRQLLGYVPQEPYVSSDRLSTNIALAEDEEESGVMHAAQMAELSADLKHLPLGLQQPIGESGVNLSGGQRQRLNLARAFHSKRPYLVLDDTLSAVDHKTEVLLMKQLMERTSGFILVTHRLSEIMNVDQVIVLKNGGVAETGSPADLLKNADSAFNKALQAYSNEPEVNHG
jgi:ATP-binding cassette subfamily B protein